GVDQPVAVVVETVAAIFDVAVVDHAIAIVVDSVATDFGGPAHRARGVVRDPAAVIVQVVAADIDTPTLSVFRAVRPERAMVAFFQALEGRPKTAVAWIALARIDGGDPNLIALGVLRSEGAVGAQAGKRQPKDAGIGRRCPSGHRVPDPRDTVLVVHPFVQTREYLHLAIRDVHQTQRGARRVVGFALGVDERDVLAVRAPHRKVVVVVAARVLHQHHRLAPSAGVVWQQRNRAALD